MTFQSFPKPTKQIKKKKRLSRVGKTPFKKLLKKAVDTFSLWIRTRDDFTCYAKVIDTEAGKCKGPIQCCHLIKANRTNTKFDEVNCNAGCSHHNYVHDQGFHPSPEIYTHWFVKVYGQTMYQDLYDRSRIPKKFTREELERIILKYTLDIDTGGMLS